MTETEWAYLAGIVDGEGYITGGVQTRRTSAGRPSVAHRIRLGVTNTNVALFRWIRERGLPGHYESTKHDEKWKRSYAWIAGDQLAVPILRSLHPYLVLKQRQAEIAIALVGLAMPATQGRKNGVPQENRDERSRLLAELQALNRKGDRGASEV